MPLEVQLHFMGSVIGLSAFVLLLGCISNNALLCGKHARLIIIVVFVVEYAFKHVSIVLRHCNLLKNGPIVFFKS